MRMETEVTVGDARLLQGDCVELMAELEPCSVDAVITRPAVHDWRHLDRRRESAKAGGWMPTWRTAPGGMPSG